MSRAIFNDRLMTHQFHVLDVDFSLAIPPWVLLPSAGFSEVTAPELTIATEDITEGTDPFTRKAMLKATMSTITLRRGVSTFNSDFWRWVVACLYGNKMEDNMLDFLKGVVTLKFPPVPGKRRNLLIIHFTGISLQGLGDALSQASGVMDKLKGALLMATGGSAAAVAQGLSSITQGFVDIGITSIPGKVYMLFDAIPTRYKPASDFDASSSEISMEELDLEYHRMEEFSLFA